MILFQRKILLIIAVLLALISCSEDNPKPKEKVEIVFVKDQEILPADSTIEYTLTDQDYQTIGDIEIQNGNEARGKNVKEYGNFYSNFPGDDIHWTKEEIYAILKHLLRSKYSQSKIGQEYLITYSAYVGMNMNFEVRYLYNEDKVFEIVY